MLRIQALSFGVKIHLVTKHLNASQVGIRPGLDWASELGLLGCRKCIDFQLCLRPAGSSFTRAPALRA